MEDGLAEILFTHEREEDMCLSGLFENGSIYNKHFVNVQVRWEYCEVTFFFFCTYKRRMLGMSVE